MFREAVIRWVEVVHILSAYGIHLLRHLVVEHDHIIETVRSAYTLYLGEYAVGYEDRIGCDVVACHADVITLVVGIVAGIVAMSPGGMVRLRFRNCVRVLVSRDDMRIVIVLIDDEELEFVIVCHGH